MLDVAPIGKFLKGFAFAALALFGVFSMLGYAVWAYIGIRYLGKEIENQNWVDLFSISALFVSYFSALWLFSFALRRKSFLRLLISIYLVPSVLQFLLLTTDIVVRNRLSETWVLFPGGQYPVEPIGIVRFFLNQTW